MFIQELYKIIPASNVITDSSLMSNYTSDWRKRYHGQALAVVFPSTTQEVATIIKLSKQYSIKIIVQGGNTSTCGAAVPSTNNSIIINLKNMNKIVSIDKANYSMVVEAGCILSNVQDIAIKNNLYFPLSLASEGSCQIGGNLATNAGGIHVVKYGTMRDLVLGLEVVLPSGEIINQLTQLRKNNTLIDVKQLFIGNEGNLGIITKVTLKLFAKPYDYCTIMFGVDDIREVTNIFSQIREKYNTLCAFEVIKSDARNIYNQYFGDKPINITNEWIIICELEITPDFNLDNFAELLLKNQVDLESCIISSNEKERKSIWQIRESIPLAEKQHGFAVKHDISIPISMWESFLSNNMPKLKQLVPHSYFSIFGHFGDGNLHYNFGIKNASAKDIEQIEQAVNNLVYTDVLALGGSIAAEHGIGQLKRELFAINCDKVSYNLMLQIKQLIDPDNLFGNMLG